MALIFVDTAKIEKIEEAASWGVLDGVTTLERLRAWLGHLGLLPSYASLEVH